MGKGYCDGRDVPFWNPGKVKVKKNCCEEMRYFHRYGLVVKDIGD